MGRCLVDAEGEGGGEAFHASVYWKVNRRGTREP